MCCGHDRPGDPAPFGPRTGATRRGFLGWVLGSSVGALVAAVLYPIVRYLIPPNVSEAVSTSVTLPVRPEEVPPNSGQIFKFGTRPGILVRTPSGEFRAFSAVCTHLACIVQYRPDLGHIWCACHNGHFDLSGTNIAGPPPRPLERFQVTVADDKIVVTRSA
jgi:cytochrome b6-f complex iron-sulfur subunit